MAGGRTRWRRPPAFRGDRLCRRFCIRGSNRNRDEPAEGRQSLFSWAYSQEEEPVQPRGRKGKPKPFSLSLFEWGLGNEKEKELVGEGHQVATQNRRPSLYQRWSPRVAHI